VVEERSGLDLSWFFRQWLYRSGVPRIEGSWRYDPVPKQIRVEIQQTQEGDVFRLPFELAIAAEGEPQPRVEKLDMRDRHVSVSYTSNRAPVSVTLDPGTWVLMDARFAERR
jgi:aminopeptidase N